MRTAALLAAALLSAGSALAVIPARPGAPEALRAGAEAAFTAPFFLAATPAAEAGAPAAEAEDGASVLSFGASEDFDASPVMQGAVSPVPARPGEEARAELARVSLPALLDRQRALLTRTLGEAPREIGVAANAAFRGYYLTFRSPGGLTALAPLGDVGRLIGEGIVVRVDPRTAYRLTVRPNFLNLVRGSTIVLAPAEGTRGPTHEIVTGAVFDAARRASAVFRSGGAELWLAYGTDVRDDGAGFAGTRSFLFVRENGSSSKTWSLAETSIPEGRAVTVSLDGLRLTLQRTGSELVIRGAR